MSTSPHRHQPTTSRHFYFAPWNLSGGLQRTIRGLRWHDTSTDTHTWFILLGGYPDTLHTAHQYPSSVIRQTDTTFCAGQWISMGHRLGDLQLLLHGSALFSMVNLPVVKNFNWLEFTEFWSKYRDIIALRGWEKSGLRLIWTNQSEKQTSFLGYNLLCSLCVDVWLKCRAL